MFYAAAYDSPVGKLTLCSNGERLNGVWIENQKYFGGTAAGKMVFQDNLPFFNQVRGWLDRYFAGEQPAVRELPLAPAGGEFRQAVWKILCNIPYGQVTTYGAVAKKIAAEQGRKSMSSQAAGGAVSHNPISIIIPCHRVVGANGSLTGYAGGIANKIKLLKHEGVDTSRFSVPKK